MSTHVLSLHLLIFRRRERTIHVVLRAPLPQRDPKLVKLLLELGIDIDKRVDNRRLFQHRPLASAFDHSRQEEADALLNAGVLLSARLCRPKLMLDVVLTKQQEAILAAAVRYSPFDCHPFEARDEKSTIELLKTKFLWHY